MPPFISQLTGITQAEVDRFGIPVRQAFSSFLDFVEDLPVFFHNASFDRRFLAAASDQTGLAFANPVHCTLALARRAWPELPSHKLDILARHVGASDPTHRALADVRTTVAVALAAGPGWRGLDARPMTAGARHERFAGDHGGGAPIRRGTGMAALSYAQNLAMAWPARRASCWPCSSG